jgi:hypothetical protein
MDPILQAAVIVAASDSPCAKSSADAGAQLFGLLCGLIILVCVHIVYRQIDRSRRGRLATKRINTLKAWYYDR